ncbi:hypothetical protein C1752_17099 [Acaryochloris thomasi RCC1774]|uniref:CobQ/CobB/MinD/ParA nucleotide binding domain-containing protein n=1 Tax=Acaryochloris thomasi RCC1774 TaxID=1764569 RepID=A0A2W1J6C0_9CYAN|nr:ParA family protein [Acaryochloris thomasi]PZD70193.1 hypothetical protein C1752_17099 [Acaryochloris thomasi RCC1774]
MLIVTFTGYKGGVGKSTSAIHLATFLSKYGNVLLVDGDPNRTSISWASRGHLPFDVADERKAAKAIPGRDWLVIDTPARPNSDDLKELADGCDLMILPTIPDINSLEPMIDTSKALKNVSFRALITMAPPHPNKDGEQMQQDMQASDVPVFESIIRRSTAFAKAALAGVPIRELKGKSRLPWLDYEQMGKEVLEILR